MTKVSFFVQCVKKQLIILQNFNVQTCFSQFLWFFSLEFWFKVLIISRKINGNKDVKFLECGHLLVQWYVKLTLIKTKQIRFGSFEKLLNFSSRVKSDWGFLISQYEPTLIWIPKVTSNFKIIFTPLSCNVGTGNHIDCPLAKGSQALTKLSFGISVCHQFLIFSFFFFLGKKNGQELSLLNLEKLQTATINDLTL